MGKFVYKGYTKEVIDRKTQERRKDMLLKEGVTTFSPKVGTSSRIRILPQTWTEEADLWFKEIYVHYGIGPENSTFLCLRKVFNKKCPICEAMFDAQTEEERARLTPKIRLVAYIIDRADEEPIPKIWFMPPKVANQILLQAKDEDSGEVLLIDHPYEGYDVTITTTKGPEGTGIKFTYDAVAIARKPSPIHQNPKIVEKVLDFIIENPIPSILVVKDYVYLSSVLNGNIVDDIEEDVASQSKYVVEEDNKDFIEETPQPADIPQPDNENKKVDLEAIKRKWKK